MKMKYYKTVDEYLANFTGETRQKLDEIRKLCHQQEPKTEEKISYGIPTMALGGKYWIYFAGYDTHIAIYPLPNHDDRLTRDVEPYKAGKGTLRFSIKDPLPIDLIKRVIKAKHVDYLQKNI